MLSFLGGFIRTGAAEDGRMALLVFVDDDCFVKPVAVEAVVTDERPMLVVLDEVATEGFFAADTLN